jgi:hypothetical protein
MEAVTGVFQTRETAERALTDVRNAGIAEGKVTLLTPGTVDHVEKEVREIPTDTAEQPGMANAMGALLGGGIGFTGGSVLMALIPGLGPVTALGLLGAGILGRRARPSEALLRARLRPPALRACPKTKSSYTKTACGMAEVLWLPLPKTMVKLLRFGIC